MKYENINEIKIDDQRYVRVNLESLKRTKHWRTGKNNENCSNLKGNNREFFLHIKGNIWFFFNPYILWLSTLLTSYSVNLLPVLFLFFLPGAPDRSDRCVSEGKFAFYDKATRWGKLKEKENEKSERGKKERKKHGRIWHGVAGGFGKYLPSRLNRLASR